MPAIRFDLVLPSSQLAWGDYLSAAQAADTMRYKTFWGFDHLLPVWGDMDGPCFEIYTTMAGIAAATKRIRVGVLVSGVAYRNPALQIKQATQVDVISGGRFDFGIGAGWAEREFKAFDIPFPEAKVRIGMLRETLDVAKLLWSGDPRQKVSYEGTYVKVTDIFLNPQPVQCPHPPILIGGAGEQLTLRVVARHADIWNSFGDADTTRRKIGLIDEYARGYGRDPGEIVKSTNVFIWVGDRMPDEALAKISQLNGRPVDLLRRLYIQGSPEAIEARLREQIALGITHFQVMGDHPALVENWQRISDEIVPRFANG